MLSSPTFTAEVTDAVRGFGVGVLTTQRRAFGMAMTRLWMAYLAVSSMAFTHGSIGIFQTLVSKRIRGASGMPPTRADLYR